MNILHKDVVKITGSDTTKSDQWGCDPIDYFCPGANYLENSHCEHAKQFRV